MPRPQRWSPSWPTSSHGVSWKCRSPESSPSTMCGTRTGSSNCATPVASWCCNRERRRHRRAGADPPCCTSRLPAARPECPNVDSPHRDRPHRNLPSLPIPHLPEGHPMSPTHLTAPIAVLGATGQQGSATVDALLDRGLPVRAITRNVDSAAARALTKRDVAVVAADLETPESIRVAFEGAAAAFAMTSFTALRGPEGEISHGRTILDAAQGAGLPFLVYSSAGGAERNTGIPHFESKRRIEEFLIGSVPVNVIRPTYFMVNLPGTVAPCLSSPMSRTCRGGWRANQTSAEQHGLHGRRSGIPGKPAARPYRDGGARWAARRRAGRLRVRRHVLVRRWHGPGPHAEVS